VSSREFGRTCPLRPGTRWRGHHRVRHRIRRSERWTPSLIASSYGPLQSAGGVPFSQELLVKAERYNCVPPRGGPNFMVRDRQVSVVAGRAGAGPSLGPRRPLGPARCGARMARMGRRPDGPPGPLAIPDAAMGSLERGATSPHEGIEAHRPRQPLRWPTCSTLKRWWPDSASAPRRFAPGACPP
jgi:hypothetical protein